MIKEIYLHDIFNGMSKELQFIIIRLTLMGIGWYLPKSFISFLFFCWNNFFNDWDREIY